MQSHASSSGYTGCGHGLLDLMQMVGGHVLNSVLTLSFRLLFIGEVLPVLARPGLLDLWEHPGVCRGLRGPGGLHHPQVLHPSGTHQRLLWLLGSEVGGLYSVNSFPTSTHP